MAIKYIIYLAIRFWSNIVLADIWIPSHTKKRTQNESKFNQDLVEFLSVAIYFGTQTENPNFKNFIDNCLNKKYGGVSLARKATLCNNYLPILFNEKKNAIKEELSNKYIYIFLYFLNVFTLSTADFSSFVFKEFPDCKAKKNILAVSSYAGGVSR